MSALNDQAVIDLAPTLLRGSPCYLRCRSVPTQSMGTSHSVLEVVV